ncbi:Enoyl-of acyl-carrier-protein reductase of NADH [Spatholobus suberectus]|nr:Enoyl-of acyl-carrier-protein reductase of NADH [Spatholobus suberectus]
MFNLEVPSSSLKAITLLNTFSKEKIPNQRGTGIMTRELDIFHLFLGPSPLLQSPSCSWKLQAPSSFLHCIARSSLKVVDCHCWKLVKAAIIFWNFHRGFASSSIKFVKSVTKVMSESSAKSLVSGLPFDLKDGSLMEITKVYPLDAVFDNPDDVPEDIKTNKRYVGSTKWTVQEVAESVKEDFGSIDILVHSLANGPEVTKPLLETSRKGYLAAISASSGSSISLTYIASERIIPGYGGGMSSAKAALESDTREESTKLESILYDISAGPLRSRAAKAIGFIDMMIDYSLTNAPLQKELFHFQSVGNAAAFLASPLASAITGTVLYVDNGLNAMGVGVDSPIFKDLDIPKDQH